MPHYFVLQAGEVEEKKVRMGITEPVPVVVAACAQG